MGHGIIVASLKVVNNNGNLVDEKEDSLVGIKRFGQLFPTYFLYRVVVALAGIVVGVIGMLLMYTMITDAQFSNLSQLVLCMLINQRFLKMKLLILLLHYQMCFICFYTRNYYFDFICLFIIKIWII